MTQQPYRPTAPFQHTRADDGKGKGKGKGKGYKGSKGGKGNGYQPGKGGDRFVGVASAEQADTQPDTIDMHDMPPMHTPHVEHDYEQVAHWSETATDEAQQFEEYPNYSGWDDDQGQGEFGDYGNDWCDGTADSYDVYGHDDDFFAGY